MDSAEADRTIVEQVAQDALDRYGQEAVPILRERAEIADGLSDGMAVKAWRDIADAAERIYEGTQAMKS